MKKQIEKDAGKFLWSVSMVILMKEAHDSMSSLLPFLFCHNVKCLPKVVSASQMLYLLNDTDGPVAGIYFHQINAACSIKIVWMSYETSESMSHCQFSHSPVLYTSLQQFFSEVPCCK